MMIKKIAGFIMISSLLFSCTERLNTKQFMCPTSDSEYAFKIDSQDFIKSGTLGAYLFKIHKDSKVKALINGNVNIEVVVNPVNPFESYKVILKNEKYKVTYFSIDSVYILDGIEIQKGEEIGEMILQDKVIVSILENGKYFNVMFDCYGSGSNPSR